MESEQLIEQPQKTVKSFGFLDIGTTEGLRWTEDQQWEENLWPAAAAWHTFFIKQR